MCLLKPTKSISGYTPIEAAAKIVDFKSNAYSKPRGLTPFQEIRTRYEELTKCAKKLNKDSELRRFYPEFYNDISELVSRQSHFLWDKLSAMQTYENNIINEISSHIEINTPTSLKIRHEQYNTSGGLDYTACIFTISGLYQWCEENRIETDAFNPEHQKPRYNPPPRTTMTLSFLKKWAEKSGIETDIFSTEEQIAEKRQYRENELLEILFQLETVKKNIRSKIEAENKAEPSSSLKAVLTSLEDATSLASKNTLTNLERLNDLNGFNLELAAKERELNIRIKNLPIENHKQKNEQPLNASIGATEKQNLLKTIGSLASALADSNISSKYGTKDSVNQLSIAKTLIKEYSPKNLHGFSERSLTTRLNKAAKELLN
jgi:hypothetical protein